jgi:hypothetical protein
MIDGAIQFTPSMLKGKISGMMQSMSSIFRGAASCTLNLRHTLSVLLDLELSLS